LSLVECSVLLGTGGLPAKNKWGSMSSALAEISLGVLIHAVLPRAFRAAFPSFDDGQLPQLDNDAVDEEYQVVVKRKVYRVGKYLGPLGNTFRARQGLLANFVLEPLDWLWQRLQHLDEQSKPLFEITTPSRSPFIAVEKRLSAFLQCSFAETSLTAVWNHYSYERTEADNQELTSEIVNMVLKVVAQVRWRFTMFFEAWPFPLVRLCDPAVPESEKAKVAESLFSAPPCCVDAYCSQKIRLAHGNPESLRNDRDLMGLLTSWSHHARVCNMHVERIFALIRKSSPEKKPNVERLCSAGFLSQLVHSHRKAGGTDITAFQRSHLLATSVPIAAVRQTVAAHPSMARGHLLFMSHKVSVGVNFRSGTTRNSYHSGQSVPQTCFQWRIWKVLDV
jgi:hypothetical protein